MKLYRAITENNLDPEELGRVQVRIYGVHSFDDKRELEGSVTSDLPWAEVIGGTEFGLNQGVGASSVLRNGTLVWVLFEEDDPNRPTILGTIKGKENGQSDINKNARGVVSGVISKKNSTLDPLEAAQSPSIYPENNVIESSSGHMIELDNSPGNERVQIIDKNGNYSEMKLSSYIDKAVKDKINIVLGELKEHVVGKTTIKSDSDVVWSVGGNFTLNVSGKVTVQAGPEIDLDAGIINLN